MRVILPKTNPNLEELRHLPLFFLAGPCTGCWDWQPMMADLLLRYGGDCICVVPRRYNDTHPLQKYRLPGQEKFFPRALPWERHYLKLAAHLWPRGAIVFHLASEDPKNPRNDGIEFARDTKGEVNEWRGQLLWNRSLRVVIGHESDFPGLDIIQRNYREALGSDYPFYTTMEETAMQAIKMARAVRPSLS